MSEKRSELRIPLMARVDILWEDAERVPRIAPAVLEDRSQGGLSVRITTQIPVGADVTVRWGSQQVSGTVTNCRRNKADYIMGVKRELVQSVE